MHHNDASAATLPPSKYLGFQFEDLEQQRESATMGMWIFLATEVLFFGALFTSYLVYRAIYPAAFAAASSAMKYWYGTINTFVLICSSLTMAMAVHSAAIGARRLVVIFLIVTMLLGTTFCVIKGFEYYAEWQEHHVPGPGFHFPESPDERHSEILFSLYFIMTGIHAVHLTIGIIIVGVIAFYASRGHYPPEYHTPIENVGLYWHFVDIVWVFLYPMIYLIAHKHG